MTWVERIFTDYFLKIRVNPSNLYSSVVKSKTLLIMVSEQDFVLSAGGRRRG